MFSPDMLVPKRSSIWYSGSVTVRIKGEGSDGVGEHYYFRRENRNPTDAYEKECAQTAVNAVSIIFNIPWREAFDRLTAQSHSLCHMPAANLNIGDCLIRAAASVLGMTWHEAVDILAECGDYGYTALNTPPVFIPFLYRHGFFR